MSPTLYRQELEAALYEQMMQARDEYRAARLQGASTDASFARWMAAQREYNDLTLRGIAPEKAKEASA